MTAGTGFVVYHVGEIARQQAMGLGGQAEVYDAKMVGIAHALRACVEIAVENPFNHVHIRHLHIFADNTSAITRSTDAIPTPGQRWALAI